MPGTAPDRPGSVDVERVSRRFGERRILVDVTWRVTRGSIAAVTGSNGSGKSSFLRIVAGLLTPDGGRVLVCGAPPGRGAASWVPAGDRALNWRLTARRNIGFFARLAARERVDEEVEAAAEMLDASDLLDRRVGECSTGQRRRLMIAAAMVQGAPVLVVDEPLADLDPEGAGAVGAAFRRWADAGGVVLIAAPTTAEVPPSDVVFALEVPRG